MPQDTFLFQGYDADITRGHIDFHFKVLHNNEDIPFTETIIYDPTLFTSRVPKELLSRILNGIHLILGISYWKTYCPPNIRLTTVRLTKGEAGFWETVYTKGLGEFFFKNTIDFRGLVRFPAEATDSPLVLPVIRTEGALVQLGGGKDSLVTSELLHTSREPYTLITVAPTPIHDRIAEAIAAPFLRIERKIDPKLLELNKRSDVYNGHIPISAIYAWIDLYIAAICGKRYIIASNEESANYGNVNYLGEEMNHQWSKSFEFEKLFQQYVRQYITPDITYFSLLRPLKEITIIKQFTNYSKYFGLFTSCNKNFQIVHRKVGSLWCGQCPKCAFVFLLLAVFLSKKELVRIFGKNLFEDPSLLTVYKELLGLVGTKPFECIGTPDECRYALYKAVQSGKYANDILIRKLQQLLKSVWQTIPAIEPALFSKSPNHLIPDHFARILANV